MKEKKEKNPFIVPIVSQNEERSFMYVGATKEQIKKGDLKEPGWAGSSWKETEKQYHDDKRDTGNPDDIFRMLIVYEVPKNDMPQDKKIHQIVEKKGYTKSRKFHNDDNLGTEFFHNCPISIITESIFEFYNKKSTDLRRIWNAAFHPYQKEDALNVSNLLLSTSFLLFYYFFVSPTRSGKSLVVGLILQNLYESQGVKNYVILTPHPDGYGSFDKYFNKHIDSKNFECFNLRGISDLKDILKRALDNNKKGINNVFFFSWAKLKNKEKRVENILNFLSKMNIFGVIIDEYHREADTEKSIDLLINRINPKFVLGVSATPYTEFMTGKANASNTVLRYEDDIKAWKLENNIPDYNQSLYYKDLLETVKDFLRQEGNFNEDEEFTFDKLFEISSNCDILEHKEIYDKKCSKCRKTRFLKYYKAIVFMLKEYLSDPAKLQGIPKYDEWLCIKLQDGKSNKVLDHIIGYLPSSEASLLLANLINENFPEYKAISWTSSYSHGKQSKFLGLSKEYRSVEEKLTQWQKKQNSEGYKTIILTCESLTTAVTLPMLSSVLILKNISSVELFMQIIGRPNNSGYELNFQNEEGEWVPRQTAAIVPKGVFLEICAKMAPFGAAIHKEDNFESIMKKMLRNMNIFSWEGTTWGSVTSQDIIDSIAQYASVSNLVRLDLSDINRINLSKLSDAKKKQYFYELDFSIKSNSAKGNTSLGDEGNDGKTFASGNKKNPNPQKMTTVQLNRELENKIQNLFNLLPFFVIIRNINNIEDLLRFPEEDFNRLLKVKKETFVRLFEDGIICKNIWNYKLKFNSNITDKNLKSPGEKGFEARFHQINSLDIFKIDESIVFEPPKLTTEIIGQLVRLHICLKNSKNILILEKNGSFTYSTLKYIGYNNLSKITIITLDPLCREIMEYILGEDLKLLTVKSIKDLKEFSSMPDFDTIIINPPYSRGLHMKFLEIAYQKSKKCVLSIQPSVWLLSPDEYAQNIKVKDLIKQHISEIILLNGNPIFHVYLFTPLSIVLIDKEKKNSEIKVKDMMNKTESIIHDISSLNVWGGL